MPNNTRNGLKISDYRDEEMNPSQKDITDSLLNHLPNIQRGALEYPPIAWRTVPEDYFMTACLRGFRLC